MSDTIDAYAAALLAVVRAEGNSGADDEILRFAQAVEGNDELRNTLSDASIPAASRQQIVEDLLGGKASDVTTAAVSLVVGAGRGADLPAIARALVAKLAAAEGREVAEVRSAVALTDDQTQRLAASLKQATGKDVDVRVTVDPSVLGGIVTTIGDTVIDGSVRSRLAQVKSHIG
ncbi:MAG: ATP synthase F1 subunit delta [Acidimicrobiales bacterium]|nr:ATP synthase F1 subunit delta [Acidimicrobiales bacterium]MDG1876152.1 ATP synthase F1 subunit delta [Acidimicrobiales bacterium]